MAAAAAASTITPEQASKLRSLGYRASEIAAIRPSVASVVARRGLDISIGPRVQSVGEVGVDGHLNTT